MTTKNYCKKNFFIGRYYNIFINKLVQLFTMEKFESVYRICNFCNTHVCTYTIIMYVLLSPGE